MSVCFRTNTEATILYLRAYSGTRPEGYTSVRSGQPQWLDSPLQGKIGKIVFEPDGGTVNLAQIGLSGHYGMFQGMQNLETFEGDENVSVAGISDMSNWFSGCLHLKECFDLSSATCTRMEYTFKSCKVLSVTPFIPDTVTDMLGCFYACYKLETPPTLPSGLTNMSSCFYLCSKLISSQSNTITIPSTVTTMTNCFRGCTRMTKAPSIPASVVSMANCFFGCTSLIGNIDVYNTPTSYDDIFASCNNDLYIINRGSGETVWKDIASQYGRVHYEADDNPVPSLTFSVTRVESMYDVTPAENGEYARIVAKVILYHTYLPRGWTVSFGDKTLKIDGVTQSPTWIENHDGYTYTLVCWRSLGDTARHTFTMQVNDSIKISSTVKASHDSLLVTQILPKAYKLVDYFHDDVTDTEGVAFGKFADEANLFDVDMPSRFRDSVIVDKLIGEIKLFAGDNIPTGWHLCDGSELAKADYPLLYNAIGDVWGTPTDSDHFVLPNLMGRVPVGCDANDTDFDTVGNSGGTKDAIVPYHNHTQNAHSHATSPQLYRVENRFGSGSRNAAGTYSGYGAAVNTNSQQPAIHYAGTEGNEVGANLQPYAVVNYIICCSV